MGTATCRADHLGGHIKVEGADEGRLKVAKGGKGGKSVLNQPEGTCDQARKKMEKREKAA